MGIRGSICNWSSLEFDHKVRKRLEENEDYLTPSNWAFEKNITEEEEEEAEEEEDDEEQMDYVDGNGWVMNPRGPKASKWNRLFSAAIMVSLFIDPLFYFSPSVNSEVFCIENEALLDKSFGIMRSLNDIFYWLHIFMQFRMAYVSPLSRVFGRGELITDPWKIALRYLRRAFWLDLVAALPIPQALVWEVIPNANGSNLWDSEVGLRFFLIFFQYMYRLCRLYPFSLKIVNVTGVRTEPAWFRAAHDLSLFYVASHISGGCWYIFTVERQEACWKSVCDQERQSCRYNFFDCKMSNETRRMSWLAGTNISTLCDPDNGLYQYGIYHLGVATGASSSSFPFKYTYALWIGLQAIASTGQTFMTSIYVLENIYSIIIGTLGLLLLALLIANMQRYLHSITAQIEDWRLKKTETENWMDRRNLPSELKQHVVKYDQLEWLATRGVDEEDLLGRFPVDLQKEIKRHLCLQLVRKVPLFNQMDEITQDAICERLTPSFYTQGTFLVREGDPVKQLVFIIRGQLESCTTDGGRNGFFNSIQIDQGGFCGEELLSWALSGLTESESSSSLPSSTRTVVAISDVVETFVLKDEDLRVVVLQFRKLHTVELRDTLRFYSQPWRTWAACYIQAAWKRFKDRKEVVRLSALEEENETGNLSNRFEEGGGEMVDTIFVPRPDAGMEVYAAMLISNMRRERSNRYSGRIEYADFG